MFRHIDMQATEVRPGMDTPCWPWKSGLSSSGRPYFTCDGKKVLAYRQTYELVTGKTIPEGIMLRHRCDNEICCRWDHVIEGDHQENMDDMKERERHGLPHHAVRTIRKLGKAGREHQEIADLYGLGRSTVTEIINRDNYKHVKDEEE